MKKTKVNLKTDDDRTYELNAKTEYGKLKIYGIDEISMPDATVYLERYDEKGFNITIDDKQISFDEKGNGFVNFTSYITISHWFPLYETHAKDGFYSFTGLNLSFENTYRVSVKYLSNSKHSAPFNVTNEKNKDFINVSFGGTEIPKKNTLLISVLENRKLLAFGVISLIGVLSLIFFLRERSKAK